jgi:hypothetical protein
MANLIGAFHTKNAMLVKMPSQGIIASFMNRQSKDYFCIFLLENISYQLVIPRTHHRVYQICNIG